MLTAFLKYLSNLSLPELHSTVEMGIERKGCQPHPTLLKPEDLFTALMALMVYTAKTLLYL
jgi:hypothetical protein